MNLSKRLSMVSNHVPQNSRLADIGSDHAYLPIDLVKNDVVSFAIAGEVAEGPYQHSLTEVTSQNLSDKISVRLGDGLEVIAPEDDVTVITIAGMGGGLICDILEAGFQAGKLSGRERLILQPNIREHLVRKWLESKEYAIISESIVEENKHIYEIIVAEKIDNHESLSDEEMQFGRYVEKQNPALFQKKWQEEMEKRKNIIKGLDDTKKDHKKMIQSLQEEIQEIKERLEK